MGEGIADALAEDENGEKSGNVFNPKHEDVNPTIKDDEGRTKLAPGATDNA